MATPIAQADDPLGPIGPAVNGDRSRTGCPEYTYNGLLEAAAQANVFPGSSKNFNIGAKGSASFTYHVVVSCNGTFNGKNVEFGHVEQDVSA